MVQGLRIWLQGTHVQSLVKELRSTCTAATKPTHLEPVLHSKRSRCGEKPAHRDEDSGPARHKWRVAPPITSGERPPLTATGESRCSEKPTHHDEDSGPAHHKWRVAPAHRNWRKPLQWEAHALQWREWPPLVETRVAPAHRNWRKSTQQQRPSTAKNKSEKESDTSQVFRNYNVS